jgi:hypothetical protein
LLLGDPEQMKWDHQLPGTASSGGGGTGGEDCSHRPQDADQKARFGCKSPDRPDAATASAPLWEQKLFESITYHLANAVLFILA